MFQILLWFVHNCMQICWAMQCHKQVCCWSLRSRAFQCFGGRAELLFLRLQLTPLRKWLKAKSVLRRNCFLKARIANFKEGKAIARGFYSSLLWQNSWSPPCVSPSPSAVPSQLIHSILLDPITPWQSQPALRHLKFGKDQAIPAKSVNMSTYVLKRCQLQNF